jgi:putative DNA methylase
MTYRKKLIEVALPLEIISDASAREKNIHTGLPANLHTWWSRKPLSASRAVIFASLVDDPSSDPNLSKEQIEAERQRLFGIVRRLVYPSGAEDQNLLEAAYQEIRKSTGKALPPLFDPFAGGGSIPLEAVRLGLETYASDLNPVSVILNKCMLELAPRYANHPPVNPRDSVKQLIDGASWAGNQGLIADIEYYGNWIYERAENQIGLLYPRGPNGEEIIAWIWIRTVKCKNPACGAQMPLVKKFWVSTHRGNIAWVKPRVDLAERSVQFDILQEGSSPKGTITSTGAKCIVCDKPVTFGYIREMGQAGQINYELMSIVVDTPKGRRYLPPYLDQVTVANSANPSWTPETSLPEKALGFRVQKYGITKHRDLFTKRQLVAVTTFADLVHEAREQIIQDSKGDEQYANAVTVFLSLAVDRLAQTNNTLVRWLVRKSGTSKGTPAFDRQIVSMVWEFSEGNVFGRSVGSWKAALKNVSTAFKSFPRFSRAGAKVFQHDATTKPNFLPSAPIVSTDPPYFDNIGYADLADFYYIWLRRTLGDIYPEIFGTLLTPKQSELTAATHLYNGDQNAATTHFLGGIEKAFATLASVANPSYPVTVYYAFKETERFSISDLESAYSSTGWESMLEALIAAGFLITGTWPIKTEQAARLRAIGSNALASSVVFCCRPRTENAPMTSRREFVNALRSEMPDALHEMQSGNIAPVDLAQASIGPGMAIYSRYSKVLEPNGDRLTVRTALQLINQVLDEYLAEQEGHIDEDTRFAVAWFEQYGFNAGEFGVADVLARAKNTSVDGLAHAGILESGAGKVRLYHWSEIDPDWNPETDRPLVVWEATHLLIERLNNHGEEGAAAMLAKVPPDLAAEARQLAYRLYSICERKSWAEHARDYNALVISWSASQEQAREFKEQYQQGKLF